MPIMYAHKLVKRLADIRKKQPKLMPYLRPDAKSQVTSSTTAKRPVRVQTVVVSTQHDAGRPTRRKSGEDVIKHVVKNVIPAELLDDEDAMYIVNPTGRFEIGGPHGDSGLTGRKIIVDTYGGRAPHGGGAFSGKDPIQGRPERGVRHAPPRQEHRRRGARRRVPHPGRVCHRRRRTRSRSTCNTFGTGRIPGITRTRQRHDEGRTST